jgi:hypothetical protein
MKFRKKPVVIEATQFEWESPSGPPDIAGMKFERWRTFDLGGNRMKHGPVVETAYIETLEGKMHVSRGDWIITGVKGESYPCKPDIFAATYEACDG